MYICDWTNLLEINEIRPESLSEKQKIAYQEDVSRYESIKDGFVTRLCPGCQSASALPFCMHLSFQFDRCQACFSVFMNPGPTEKMIQEFYKNSSNYKFWAEEMYPRTKEVRKATLHYERAKFALSFVNNLNNSRRLRVLEVGAGTGDSIVVLKDLMEWEADFYAVEPNPDMWPALKENEIERIAEPDLIEHGDFDLILAYEVLEHTLNPREFLKFYSKLLNSRGTLIISTPNAHSLEVQLLKENSSTLDIEHISVLTPSAIHAISSGLNLQVIEISTPGKFDVQLMWDGIGFIRKAVDEFRVEKDNLQQLIVELDISSHMKIALKKSKD